MSLRCGPVRSGTARPARTTVSPVANRVVWAFGATPDSRRNLIPLVTSRVSPVIVSGKCPGFCFVRQGSKTCLPVPSVPSFLDTGLISVLILASQTSSVGCSAVDGNVWEVVSALPPLSFSKCWTNSNSLGVVVVD